MSDELTCFKEVVRVALKNKNFFKQYLEKGRRLDYPARRIVATSIKEVMLELDSNLCPAECQRFAEIVTGVVDRVNTEFKAYAEELMDEEVNHFRNSRRSVLLDESYDAYNLAFKKQQEIINNFVKSDLNDDKELARKFNLITSIIRNIGITPSIIQKDIESGMSKKKDEENTLTDRHIEALRALQDEFSNDKT